MVRFLQPPGPDSSIADPLLIRSLIFFPLFATYGSCLQCERSRNRIAERSGCRRDYVQPRIRNRIRRMGIGTPSNHSRTQPTFPSRSDCIAAPFGAFVGFVMLNGRRESRNAKAAPDGRFRAPERPGPATSNQVAAGSDVRTPGASRNIPACAGAALRQVDRSPAAVLDGVRPAGDDPSRAPISARQAWKPHSGRGGPATAPARPAW